MVCTDECTSMPGQEARDRPCPLINTLPMPAHHTPAALLRHGFSSLHGGLALSLHSLNNEKLARAPNAGPLAHSRDRTRTGDINLYSDGAYMMNVAPSEREKVLLKT